MVHCPAKIRPTNPETRGIDYNRPTLTEDLQENVSLLSFFRTRQIQSPPRITGQKRSMDFYTLSRQLFRDGRGIDVHSAQSLIIPTFSKMM